MYHLKKSLKIVENEDLRADWTEGRLDTIPSRIVCPVAEEGESTPQYMKTYEHRSSKAWFLSCGHLKIKENVQNVYLEPQRKILHVW